MFRFPLKLVRDLVPDRIQRNGGRAVVKTLRGPALQKAMLDKIVEEAKELRRAKTTGEKIEELADIAEILAAYMREINVTPKHVSVIQQDKYNGRGGFFRGYKLIFQSGS